MRLTRWRPFRSSSQRIQTRIRIRKPGSETPIEKRRVQSEAADFGIFSLLVRPYAGLGEVSHSSFGFRLFDEYNGNRRQLICQPGRLRDEHWISVDSNFRLFRFETSSEVTGTYTVSQNGDPRRYSNPGELVRSHCKISGDAHKSYALIPLQAWRFLNWLLPFRAI